MRTASRPFLTAVVVASAVACSAALHPRTTREGKMFPAAKVQEIEAGFTEQQVREVLGEPLEVETGNSVVWRYYEKYQPRSCTEQVAGLTVTERETISVEARVTFAAGLVQSVEVTE